MSRYKKLKQRVRRLEAEFCDLEHFRVYSVELKVQKLMDLADTLGELTASIEEFKAYAKTHQVGGQDAG